MDKKLIQSLVNAHPEPFALIDEHFAIVACNRKYAEAYTHLAPHEIIGMKCHEVSHKSEHTCDINGEECPLEKVFRTQEAMQVIHRHLDRDHALEYVAIHGSPVFDDSGKLLYMGEGMHPISHEEELVFDEQKMVGCCPSFTRVLDNLCMVAGTDATVLIHGETGTGKELAAQLLHRKSSRAKGELVTVDCTQFTEDMFVNELFGHEHGAYTGCLGMKKGLVELAHKGTLFLDEIGEMPLSIQAKFLRVLETGTFRRLGGTQELKADFRLIAASNRDLKTLVEKGLFRADLYYRINCMQVELPPLRHRKDDIPELVRHFLSRKVMGKHTASISPAALDILKRYSFPGNMRELKNLLERGALLARGSLILPEHLPDEVRHYHPALDRKASALEHDFESHAGTSGAHPLTAELIRHTLDHFRGNRRLAAKALKISERTLYRRLKEMESAA
ncbi:MAG: sigma 54-interacting transcriptional regulator [Burkholderiaceae bacterium]|jgi:transcriptional regulator with PAS, ATPase and Fis domain|nr:sigma 54-interacting transcriptional regulator [Burkholderiaceae bacterium]